ncbi:hypothetical protein NLJ89_g9794 [Agrocybe chaxingu]|uniref:Protoporphyrinogen oxidase n=1 Tax=Agrocybe chaxingu TaxID=84603 RepID=A0A9W8JS05_9AGAR|nr:hypothetical protein NLJ89_g9794 [Agrocybe chaxingu]
MPPPNIAVLGGGLTGLSAAFHLSRRFPTAQITLLEKQARLGGWVRSERVELLQINASVLLEGGPRTLRPNGRPVLELVNLLQLEDRLITVPKTAAPAKSRFIYVPESYGDSVSGLQCLPSSFLSLVSSQLLSILLPAVLREPFRRHNRPSDAEDESLDSFLSRRFGETFARTFGSALVHGVYASDSRKLSVRAAFPSLWKAEERGRGSVLRGYLTLSRTKTPESNYVLGTIVDRMRGVSVFSFKDGMATLTDALEARLRSTSNVTILSGTNVTAVKPARGDFKISTSCGQTFRASHAVSALPLPKLHQLLSSSLESRTSHEVPHLLENPTSTVHVVNLVFPCPPAQVHPEGFGYLIPRHPAGYPTSADTSSPGILGVVFDSCSLHGQDSPLIEDYYNKATHTKLTVMLGGPYPTLPLPVQLVSTGSDAMPPYVVSVLDQLKHQLGRDLPNPAYWHIWNNESCIPTLQPGHLERVEEMKEALQSYGGGRLTIVGSGVGGVSVSDCIEAGRLVGKEWV